MQTLADIILNSNSFLDLEENWDSYNGSKIDELTLKQTLKWLIEFLINVKFENPEIPRIGPVPDGGINLEFKNTNLLIHFSTTKIADYYCVNSGKEYEGEFNFYEEYCPKELVKIFKNENRKQCKQLKTN